MKTVLTMDLAELVKAVEETSGGEEALLSFCQTALTPGCQVEKLCFEKIFQFSVEKII